MGDKRHRIRHLLRKCHLPLEGKAIVCRQNTPGSEEPGVLYYRVIARRTISYLALMM